MADPQQFRLAPTTTRVELRWPADSVEWATFDTDGHQTETGRFLRAVGDVGELQVGTARSSVDEQQRVVAVQRVTELSLELLAGIKESADATQKKLETSFGSYTAMLWALFGFGILAFGAALVRGFTATGTAQTVQAVTFAGLSAASFVATFIARPSGAMGEAGVRAAWAQSIITTYWTKLAYMSDPAHALSDLDDAQHSLQEAMRVYLRTIRSQDDKAVPAPEATSTPGTPATPLPTPPGAATAPTNSSPAANGTEPRHLTTEGQSR